MAAQREGYDIDVSAEGGMGRDDCTKGRVGHTIQEEEWLLVHQGIGTVAMEMSLFQGENT